MSVPSLSVDAARRLAVAKAGLLRPEWLGLPTKAGRNPEDAAQRLIEHFGYLQLDSVSVAGARTHGLVLLSRLDDLDPKVAETLLRPGRPLFEYWGHEASWLPIALYPALAFRRRAFAKHPWWGDLLGQHRAIADGILAKVETEGALRSSDLEGPRSSGGWWGHKLSKKVAEALWSAGHLVISERRNFQRSYDLPQRVIPTATRELELGQMAAIETLLLYAIRGHGWASASTLGATFRLRGLVTETRETLGRLVEKGKLVVCDLQVPGKKVRGFVLPADLELAARLAGTRLRRDRGVLLSPFDPLLWDRSRVAQLFGFEQFIEIYKKPHQRVYGYYVLPVLAGDRLIGRVDLKAERQQGTLRVVSRHFENSKPSAIDRQALEHAVNRHARALRLEIVG